MQLPEIIESLLFAGQGALTAEDLARAVQESARQRGEGDELGEALARTTPEEVNGAIEVLIRHYEDSGRAFTLVQRAAGWRLATRPEYADWVRGLFPGRKPSRLSPPALETLAIVAYRQPVTKASIEAVRGVAVDGVLQSLLDRHLVRIAGRADLPGRPLLYETSDLFLEHFGIQHVDQLPNAEELRRVHLPEAREEAGAGTETGRAANAEEAGAAAADDGGKGSVAGGQQPSLPLEGPGDEAVEGAGGAEAEPGLGAGADDESNDESGEASAALEAAAAEVLVGHDQGSGEPGEEEQPSVVEGSRPGAAGTAGER